MAIRDQTIRDVSKTLLDLLRTSLGGVAIDLLSPKTPGANRLTLFLYKVLENPYLRNEEPDVLTTNSDGKVIETRSPLTVDLFYLLTAHSGTPPDLLEAHTALSRAMRVFYDNGILRGSLLRAQDPDTGLKDDSFLHITLNPITMEDMTRIWSIFPDTPYEISVTYLVTPVAIESARQAEMAPVLDQIHEQGQLGAELQT